MLILKRFIFQFHTTTRIGMTIDTAPSSVAVLKRHIIIGIELATCCIHFFHRYFQAFDLLIFLE